MNETKTEYENHVIKPNISFTDGDQTLRSISVEDEVYLDAKLAELDNLITNNHGLGKSEEEKDLLYISAQTTWKEYVGRLKSTQYNFHLNRKQYNFLTNLLISKLEYTVDTLFLAIELTDMLGRFELGKSKSKNDNEVKTYSCDSTELIYMYHLISKHTVKGLTNDTYLFAEVLRKIGFISKITTFYDENAKFYLKDITDWVATFEQGVFVEGKNHGRNIKLPVTTTTDNLVINKAEKKSKKKEEA
jgi:hypothetical protein